MCQISSMYSSFGTWLLAKHCAFLTRSRRSQTQESMKCHILSTRPTCCIREPSQAFPGAIQRKVPLRSRDQHIKVKRFARQAILQVQPFHNYCLSVASNINISGAFSFALICYKNGPTPQSRDSVLSFHFKKRTMGQYWLVVSPSRREYTTQHFGGKLSELLFSSWPDILCDLIENEWAGTRLICIGDYLNPDDLPTTIQQDNLHLVCAESDAASKPLSYCVVQEKFEHWSYEEEEAASLAAVEESVNLKNRVLRNLTSRQCLRGQVAMWNHPWPHCSDAYLLVV